MHTPQHLIGRARRRGGAVGIALVVFLFAIAIGLIAWRVGSKEPPMGQHTRADLQRQLGVEVARVTQDVLGQSSGAVAVFVLLPQKSGPFADQLDALTAALAEKKIDVELYKPRDIGLTNDMFYTEGYELILKRTQPAVLVALVHGGIDIGTVPQILHDYMDEDGRLVLLGDLCKTDGPFLDWIRQGKAVAVARHTGVLQHRAPEARTLDPRTTPEQYFERYYTVLTAENIDQKLQGQR